ncbi:thioredoxin [Haloferax namakaokahaiae]|uniref:Thioredoxin n=1 Tax=Haloferax namakaokahaiae TaxID=1748331 RepID=A0ABD5ZFW6_9EURY
MSDEELESIRQQKRDELAAKIEGEASEGGKSPGVPSEPVYVNGAEAFEDTVSKYDVVLVDFYADWCGPCKMLEPTVERLAAETDAAIVKVDIDQNQQLAMQYQVRGVPTVMLFSDGQPAERLVGVRGYDDYERLIDSLLA